MTIPEPVAIPVPDDPAALAAALEDAPDAPAVFLVWPREGSPYLARTALLRRRLRRLLRESGPSSRALNLRAVAARIEYWRTGSPLEATLLHYELARRHFPSDYPRMLRLRAPAFVKLILSNAFPRTQVTTKLGGSNSVFYGPFQTRAAAEQFESEVLDLFQVRRCQEDLEPSPEHPGCIYGEMSMCLRPCQMAVSRDEYLGEARRLAEFLTSGGRSLSEAVAAARDRLSEEMNFEEAARQHKRLEKVQQALRLGGELACDIERLSGVAVTRSAAENAVELWFVVRGCWQPPVRFGFDVVEGRTVSMDHRLREVVGALRPAALPAAERQEHIALLTRWLFASWREGEWIGFERLEDAPYRKLVRAISRVAVRADKV